MNSIEITESNWRDIVLVPGEIIVCEVRRNRSSAHYLAYDKDNKRYVIFISDFLDMVIAGKVQEGGIINSPLKLVKKGANFGVRAINTPKVRKPKPSIGDAHPTWSGQL